MIKYSIMFVACTVILGSIIPFVQFIRYMCKTRLESSKLLFSRILLDFDMDDLQYEKINSSNKRIKRQDLSDRGWIRCPNGTVMNEEAFELKKNREYEIELP